jgi:hypothetical protein
MQTNVAVLGIGVGIPPGPTDVMSAMKGVGAIHTFP